MELTVAVCDDLPEECVRMVRLLQSYGRRRDISLQMEVFKSGEALQAALRFRRWDIVLLDIYMDGVDGIEAARSLRETDPECILLFITTSVEHGVISYQFRASDYLVKPVEQRSLDETLDWCLREYAERFKTLAIRSEYDTVYVRLRDIHYIEIQQHTACIHLADRVIRTARGMNALESEIASRDFLRCHRSFLINQNYVQRIEKRDFIMEGGDRVPIGSSDAVATRQKFMDWIFMRSAKPTKQVGIF